MLAVSADRFAAGWRLVPGSGLVEAGAVGAAPGEGAAGVEADASAITVDVVRPADLVALSFTATGCELVSSADAPVLRPVAGATARLVVRFAYQHLAEEAIYEGLAPKPLPFPPAVPGETGSEIPDPAPDPADPVNGEDARTVPPVQVLPAKTSRLVFDMPEGESIEFSTAGLLAALGRLQLVVHPLATPAPTTPPAVGPGVGPILQLPGGLAAVISDRGPVFSRATGVMRPPRMADVDSFLATTRDLRRVRALLTTTTGTVAGRTVDLGSLADVVLPPIIVRPRPRPRPTLSRPPEPGETALEAPFRLVISPSRLAGWAHAADPVRAADAPGHVELWHTRMGVREERADGTVAVDERSDAQRTVRAVWARDREGMGAWQTLKEAEHNQLPFRMSLDGADRHMLVRQTAETWVGQAGKLLTPEPVEARELWLSALGAWLDLHGDWTTGPYSAASIASILSWDHEAPAGRDQYVRVVYPGFLFPCGHQAALVKLTERKMKDVSPSVAGLYQRKFLVIGRPLLTYADQHNLPFTAIRVAPLVTPTLDDPGNLQNSFFWPRVGGADFPFVLHCADHEHRHVKLPTPLLWVAEHFTAKAANRKAVEDVYAASVHRKVPANGQQIAFAPVIKGGDTTNDTVSVSLMGTAHAPPATSTPRMTQARVRLPAVERISGVGPVPVAYAKPYLDFGFTGAGNPGQVWAATVTSDALKQLPNDEVAALPVVKFGNGAPAGSDRSGGFLSPDQPVAGLSRLTGTVGDVAGMATQKFDPKEFLKGAVPKLFGLVDLLDLLDAVGGVAPSLVNEALDRAEGFVADLQRAKQQAAEAVSEANKLVARAASKTAELQNAAQDALAKAQQAKTAVEGAVDGFMSVLPTLVGQTEAAVAAAVAAPITALEAAVGKLEQAAPTLPPLISNQLTALAKVLRQVLAAADLVTDLARLVNGLAQSGVESHFRFEWKPKLQSWPSPAHPFGSITSPIVEVKVDSLVLAVEGRVSGKGEVGVEILAELKDFTLHLLPGAPLIRIPFDHLSFRSGSAGKPDVDVVMHEIEFVGVLAFVETLKDLIPFDGFSDPPFLDVSPAGVTAGFTLTLPSVAIGVFTLANISLGADVNVPFLGKTVTVGFNFCTRERPFTLTVMAIGGGGWFGIRISPDGLDVMELGLEAGACLAVDLGVASGSVSIMVGIYMRLEGPRGSLTGYVRIRGEVDVLGLISASIELYLELRYEFDTGKMVGKASLTVQIKVFVFSGSVKIEVERKLAGSNGDPTFAQVMDVQNGQSAPWSDYCLAFAGA